MELKLVWIVTCSLLILQSTSGLQVIIRNTTTPAPSPQNTTTTPTSATPLPLKTSTTSPKPKLHPVTTKQASVKPTVTSKRPAPVPLPTKPSKQPQISKRIFDTGEKNISAIEIPSLEIEIPEEIQTVIDDKNSFLTNLLNQTIITTHRIPNALATLGNFSLIQGIALIAISGLVIGIGILVGEAWSLKKGDHKDNKFGLKGHHHEDFDESEGWGWPGEDGGGGGKFWRRIDEESSMGRPVPENYNNNRGRVRGQQMYPVYPVYSNPNLAQMNPAYSANGLQPGATTGLRQRQKKPKTKHRRRKIGKEIRKGAYVLGYNQLG